MWTTLLHSEIWEALGLRKVSRPHAAASFAQNGPFRGISLRIGSSRALKYGFVAQWQCIGRLLQWWGKTMPGNFSWAQDVKMGLKLPRVTLHALPVPTGRNLTPSVQMVWKQQRSHVLKPGSAYSFSLKSILSLHKWLFHCQKGKMRLFKSKL